MATSDKIIAAGAVVTRTGSKGTEFLLVYRNYRDDWTFPKGKVEAGEHIVGAAIREVREETGFAVKLGQPLPTQTYRIEGRLKDSHYWYAEVLSGTFVPNDEVDEIAWLTFDQASEKLTYKHDKSVLLAAANSTTTTPLIILRHTQSVKRAEWGASEDYQDEPDAYRPLTSVGRMQASMLLNALAAYGVEKIYSSDSVRCRDTVGPFATARSLAVNLEKTMSEERHQEHPQEVATRVTEFVNMPEPLILCTHRPVMPTVMNALNEIFGSHDEMKKDFDPALTPGSMVVYHRDAQNLANLISVERHLH